MINHKTFKKRLWGSIIKKKLVVYFFQVDFVVAGLKCFKNLKFIKTKSS